MVWHVAHAAFSGLMAVRIAARSPEDAGEEDGNDNGYDDEWGSDIHGQIPQIQIIRGLSDLTGWPSPGFPARRGMQVYHGSACKCSRGVTLWGKTIRLHRAARAVATF